MKHLAEEGPILLDQVWQQVSETLLERYTLLESLAGDQFGDTLSPTSQQLAAALHEARPS